MPSPAGYSHTQIALHWAVVGLVAVQVLLGEGMNTAFEAARRGFEPAFWPRAAAIVHIAAGGLVFLFAATRLTLRLRRGVPGPPAANPAPMRRLALFVHRALYAVILAIPVAGAIAWFGGNDLAAFAHRSGMTLLWFLLALHVGGALVEHFILRTDALRRMLGRGSVEM